MKIWQVIIEIGGGSDSNVPGANACFSTLEKAKSYVQVQIDGMIEGDSDMVADEEWANPDPLVSQRSLWENDIYRDVRPLEHRIDGLVIAYTIYETALDEFA